MAGVNMRLEVGAVRYVFCTLFPTWIPADDNKSSELHWHKTVEVSRRASMITSLRS